MPVYIVTGRLGGGKTLSMVGRMREYMEEGRPVATNINLRLSKLLKKPPTAPVYRMPDKPSADDFEALGAAHETGDESRNGGIFLDEAGTWLNSRSWADKQRQAVIDWLLHSRKKGWDVFVIVQSINLLDKQIREAMGEYLVICRRLDRMQIPFLGKLIRGLSLGYLSGNLPHVHVASVNYGLGLGAVHSDTWWYRGRDLYAAYDTKQVITGERSGVELMPWSIEGAPVVVPKHKPKLPEVAALMGIQDPAERLKAYRRLELVSATPLESLH